MSRRVVIESPYAGDVERNTRYLRAALRHSLSLGESPIASHGLFPGALDDNDPHQRKVGIAAGYAWWSAADAIVFYVDLGMSNGMQAALDKANSERAVSKFVVEFRAIGPEWDK